MTGLFPKAVLLDLDDTLILEEDFVRSGLSAVAETAAPILGLLPDALTDLLWYDFRRLGRTGLFDRLLAAHPSCGLSVKELVKIYREHQPRLSLDATTRDLLVRLRARTRLAIVTDGLPATQQRKIDALALAGMVDTIVFPWALDAPKPSPVGFLEACCRLDVRPEEAVIVGDDPFHDIAAARNAGMACIRIRKGRAFEIETREPPPVYREIGDLAELETALALLASGAPDEGAEP